MMMANIVILVAMVLFDLSAKYVAGFYTLVVGQNYINFECFRTLLNSDNALKQKTLPFQVFMHIMYALLLAASFTS